MSDRLVQALERNSEIIALSTVLQRWPHCDGNCGRLATKDMGWNGYAPMCDQCSEKVKENWRNNDLPTDEITELKGANRVRRLEALLANKNYL